MAISLSKGGNVSLSKESPGLDEIIVGLGWDVRATDGQDFDLDASAIVVGADGRVLSDKHFVFFNNLTSPDGTVEHTGDNLTGEGEGDDEQVKVNLAGLAAEADKVVAVLDGTRFVGTDAVPEPPVVTTTRPHKPVVPTTKRSPAADVALATPNTRVQLASPPVGHGAQPEAEIWVLTRRAPTLPRSARLNRSVLKSNCA